MTDETKTAGASGDAEGMFYGDGGGMMGKPAGVTPSHRGGDPVAGFFSRLVQLCLALAGCGLVWHALATLAVAQSAMHEIYCAVAGVGGLGVIGLAGVWGAVDALRRG